MIPSEQTSLLMADRRDHPAHHVEAEPVRVTVTGDLAEVELDDGVWLGFDAGDLRAALTPELAQSRGTDHA